MLRKIHGTNLFHIKFLGCNNIKCQNGPVLPTAQVFYFNGQALAFCHLFQILGNEHFVKVWYINDWTERSENKI
jgi:hypothetical protein